MLWYYYYLNYCPVYVQHDYSRKNFKEHIICKKNYISVFHNHPEHCPPQEPCVTGQVVYKVLKKMHNIKLKNFCGLHTVARYWNNKNCQCFFLFFKNGSLRGRSQVCGFPSRGLFHAMFFSFWLLSFIPSIQVD